MVGQPRRRACAHAVPHSFGLPSLLAEGCGGGVPVPVPGRAMAPRQSAPVRVPAAWPAGGWRAGGRKADEDEEDDEEVVPPHVVAARRHARSSSVLEGTGRTVKGRDLRSVRNAVLRQTGFLDL
ncbi:OJ000126_13.10 protein [Zea mays]|uniref:OJ000126_13.10 protein n=1 Tax=Zea mays TaxID=4577 RepID=A0A1D6Q6M4_MAIZE|nr:OJ000126_13.10 protein [Zea mays]